MAGLYNWNQPCLGSEHAWMNLQVSARSQLAHRRWFSAGWTRAKPIIGTRSHQDRCPPSGGYINCSDISSEEAIALVRTEVCVSGGGRPWSLKPLMLDTARRSIVKVAAREETGVIGETRRTQRRLQESKFPTSTLENSLGRWQVVIHHASGFQTPSRG
ncbi:hypothetical protein BD779DRAFT_980608 [Infundibulicybe gibba]|nr:hypothetical protein BD779DRAFT_980608 [Infundibulicybe gibba]